MRALVWLFRAAVFFTLFAFALNNQQEAAVRWFFGQEWRAPMVFIVLGSFALGCAFGVVAMVPSWWKQRRVARRHTPATGVPVVASPTVTAPASLDPLLEHPPRDGL
jgi:putative membrane protein